jgi:hypothetical protein
MLRNLEGADDLSSSPGDIPSFADTQYVAQCVYNVHHLGS